MTPVRHNCSILTEKDCSLEAQVVLSRISDADLLYLNSTPPPFRRIKFLVINELSVQRISIELAGISP